MKFRGRFYRPSFFLPREFYTIYNEVIVVIINKGGKQNERKD